jgi:localization factor PodJL
LHQKLEFRPAPQIDSRMIEQAAEMLANRLEQRGCSAIDAEALVNQISEIHGRLDALNVASTSQATFERMIAELIEGLETTQHVLQSKASASMSVAPLASGIADLRAEQADSDRRMEARFGDVQEILEKLVDRLARMEAEADREPAQAPAPARPIPNFAPLPSAAPPAKTAPAFAEAHYDDIPDRAAKEPARAAPSSARSLDDSDFLLEPGSPTPMRRAGDEAANGRNAAINAHIAAARRAAQAALAESAKRKDESPARRTGEPGRPSGLSTGLAASSLMAARRRPILLGVGGAALLAIVGTLAVVELRSGKPPMTQKSELTAPASDPAHTGASASPEAAPKTSSRIDNSPVGAIVPASRPAPSDLVASLPTTLPAALRDAAALGDAGAETELALRYIEGRGLARDPKLAARWFEQAALEGLPVAQYRLAALYDKGIGVTRDVSLARSWYLKAANAGNARAMHNLAVLEAGDSDSGKPDYTDATQWFRRAAELGVRDSQFNLGVLYGRGLGVSQDLGRSWMWFSLAAQQGDSDAAKKRDEVGAKLDAATLAAATKALADFRTSTPTAGANEVPAPAGGWEGKSGAPQAGRASSSGSLGGGARG